MISAWSHSLIPAAAGVDVGFDAHGVPARQRRRHIGVHLRLQRARCKAAVPDVALLHRFTNSSKIPPVFSCCNICLTEQRLPPGWSLPAHQERVRQSCNRPYSLGTRVQDTVGNVCSAPHCVGRRSRTCSDFRAVVFLSAAMSAFAISATAAMTVALSAPAAGAASPICVHNKQASQPYRCTLAGHMHHVTLLPSNASSHIDC